jgi:SAM-dependent methyltransferase
VTPDITGVVALAQAYRRNRFMPVPPEERNFAGDGDFRAIGAEFLTRFVRMGGLYPAARVVEIGCGIGRMALPLTQYLTGGYDGIDIVKDGIDWCARTITPVYDNFRFHHRDYRNPVYNPAGILAMDHAELPFAAGAFDFAILTSVLTHLDAVASAAYAAEVARLLRPGGRCFLSLFLITPATRAGITAGHSRFAFDADGAGPIFEAEPDCPGHAVACDESWLLEILAGHGLTPARPIAYGAWSGRTASHYQDLLVLEKTPLPAVTGPAA